MWTHAKNHTNSGWDTLILNAFFLLRSHHQQVQDELQPLNTNQTNAVWDTFIPTQFFGVTKSICRINTVSFAETPAVSKECGPGLLTMICSAVSVDNAWGGSWRRKKTLPSRSISDSYTPSLCTRSATQFATITATITGNRKSMPRVPSTTITTTEIADRKTPASTAVAQMSAYNPGCIAV